MKKVFVIFLIMLFVFALNTSAQKADSFSNLHKGNGLKISAGFLMAPIGVVSLYSMRDFKKGTKTDVPIYTFIQLKTGRWSLNPFYLMTSTSCGAFLDYSFPKITLFGVATKSLIKNSDISAGLGILWPFLKWKTTNGIGGSVSFLGELKSSLLKFDPYAVGGLLFNFSFIGIKK
jgi:hypothetical protein